MDLTRTACCASQQRSSAAASIPWRLHRQGAEERGLKLSTTEAFESLTAEASAVAWKIPPSRWAMRTSRRT